MKIKTKKIHRDSSDCCPLLKTLTQKSAGCELAGLELQFCHQVWTLEKSKSEGRWDYTEDRLLLY